MSFQTSFEEEKRGKEGKKNHPPVPRFSLKHCIQATSVWQGIQSTVSLNL